MRWGHGEHSAGRGCCLQRGAGGHGEPRGAGEAGGRLSRAAGGVCNARTQLLARSPGAGERPGGKKKMNKTLKQAQPKGARMGRGAYGGPKSSAPVSGRHGEPPKSALPRAFCAPQATQSKELAPRGEEVLLPCATVTLLLSHLSFTADAGGSQRKHSLKSSPGCWHNLPVCWHKSPRVLAQGLSTAGPTHGPGMGQDAPGEREVRGDQGGEGSGSRVQIGRVVASGASGAPNLTPLLTFTQPDPICNPSRGCCTQLWMFPSRLWSFKDWAYQRTCAGATEKQSFSVDQQPKEETGRVQRSLFILAKG